MSAPNANISAESRPDTARRTRLWVNWLLAVSTILGAVAVQLFAMGAVMSTAACSNPNCPKPSGFVYGLLTYGAPWWRPWRSCCPSSPPGGGAASWSR